MRAGAGPHIENVIGGQHRFGIVFHYDHRIPQIAQPEQCLQEPAIVALMQANGRFIENVQDSHESRADLRGEPDALAFASGERRRGPIEREIIEARRSRETQAVP